MTKRAKARFVFIHNLPGQSRMHGQAVARGSW